MEELIEWPERQISPSMQKLQETLHKIAEHGLKAMVEYAEREEITHYCPVAHHKFCGIKNDKWGVEVLALGVDATTVTSYTTYEIRFIYRDDTVEGISAPLGRPVEFIAKYDVSSEWERLYQNMGSTFLSKITINDAQDIYLVDPLELSEQEIDQLADGVVNAEFWSKLSK